MRTNLNINSNISLQSGLINEHFGSRTNTPQGLQSDSKKQVKPMECEILNYNI